MKSKDRVRNMMQRKPVDRVPAHFSSTEYVMKTLKRHFFLENDEKVYEHFEIDTRNISPEYTGPKLIGNRLSGMDYETTDLFGSVTRHIWNGKEYNSVTIHHPLDAAETSDDVDKLIEWPRPEWFNYESIKSRISRYKDKALFFGHWGPFQTATGLRSEEKLFMDMILNPDLAKRIFHKMHEFQMWHYENILIAGDGEIDVLRTHDDYGTQISLLFSMDMWRDYFKQYTRELAELAHKYGAFFQQHSCGAVRPIIPELIDCGVDSLEPLQPVAGMEPEGLFKDFGMDLSFCGGIDTQHLLPFGTVKEVKAEAKRYMSALGKYGGYLLYPSQSWESCVPVENIEAMYSVRD